MIIEVVASTSKGELRVMRRIEDLKKKGVNRPHLVESQSCWSPSGHEQSGSRPVDRSCYLGKPRNQPEASSKRSHLRHDFQKIAAARENTLQWHADCFLVFSERIETLSRHSRRDNSMGTILLIILLLLLIGALPTFPYSRNWGYFPSGSLGLVLVIVLILALMKKI
jgi:Protein of unknown function (DUF3309)